MDLPALLLSAVAVLSVLVIVLLLSHRRQKRAWAHRRARDVFEFDQNLAAAESAHRDHLAQLQRQQQATDALRDRALLLAARGMKWELASREALVKACEAASLDAVIATNAVFTVASEKRSFCAQIDHVVMTDNMLLVVDSKNWKGLVFDGKLPSELAEPLSILFDEDALTPPFAIQIRTEDPTALRTRIESGPTAPAKQVRVGAERLHTYLSARAGKIGFIDTCVFYSHPDARVITEGYDTAGSAHTLIADIHTIGRVIKRAHHKRSDRTDPSRVERVAKALEELGADLVGTGRYATPEPSPVPLEYRVQTRRERAAARAAASAPGPA